MTTPDLLSALHALKEDAIFAYNRALNGDETGLEALGRSMKLVEQAVGAADAAKRLNARRPIR